MYSVLQAEREVEERLADFRMPVDIRIPIEMVIQKFSARITPLGALAARFKVEAVIRRIRRGGDGKKFRVFVDREIANGKLSYYRFVLAEEAGHFLADGPTVATVKTLDDTLHIHQNPEWQQLERNREMIGRVWLAPNSLLERLVPEHYSEAISHCGFSEGAVLRIDTQLAKSLGMPIDQVKTRMKECSLEFDKKIQASMVRRDLALGQIYATELMRPRKRGKRTQKEMLF